MNLTIQDLGAIGELLGSVAVLATLVYLALQTRQNTMAISAQLDAARITSIQELLLAPTYSNELQEALNQRRIDSSSIDQNRVENYWTAMLLNGQWQLQQARRGLLPSFNEAGAGRTVAGLFATFSDYGDFWERFSPALLPEFVEWVEEQRAKAA